MGGEFLHSDLVQRIVPQAVDRAAAAGEPLRMQHLAAACAAVPPTPEMRPWQPHRPRNRRVRLHLPRAHVRNELIARTQLWTVAFEIGRFALDSVPSRWPAPRSSGWRLANTTQGQLCADAAVARSA